MREKTAPGKGKGLGRHAAPLCTESSVPLSTPTCKDVMGTTYMCLMYVWFFFFFCIRIKQYYVSWKNCEFVEVKTVVICFEVNIIISIITLNIMSSADMDFANKQLFFWFFFCKYKNLKMQSCLVSAASCYAGAPPTRISLFLNF